jgi:hypothetical protein
MIELRVQYKWEKSLLLCFLYQLASFKHYTPVLSTPHSLEIEQLRTKATMCSMYYEIQQKWQNKKKGAEF